jgi:hypothetical protein
MEPMQGLSITPTTEVRPLIRFLRSLSSAALELAHELETVQDGDRRSLADVDLGSLQRPIAETPSMNSDAGVSPREITNHLSRSDEPNVRIALEALRKRGIAEMVPGVKPQRWRLTSMYRSE